MPRKRYGLKIALGVGIALLSCYLLFSWHAHLNLNHELELARRAGLWTTFDDLAQRPTPPADRNAAPIYTKACRAFEAGLVNPNEPAPLPVLNALNTGGEPAFSEFYTRADPFLREFERAAAMPECLFPRDRSSFTSMFKGESWEPHDMWWALKTVCTRAMLLSRHHHPVEALDLMRRFAPMAHHAASDIEGNFQSIRMGDLVTDAIQTILGAHGLEPHVTEEAKAALAAIGPPPDPLTVLRGDCLLTLFQMNDPSARQSFNMGSSNFLRYLQGARDVWTSDVVHAFRASYAAVREVHSNAGVLLGRFREVEKRQGNVGFVFSGTIWYGEIARAAARREALATLIAGLESWRRTGMCPTSLPVTDPRSIDPITGGPVRFAKTPDGFKVWCIATDGTDHTSPFVPTHGLLSALDTVYSYPYVPPVRKTSRTW